MRQIPIVKYLDELEDVHEYFIVSTKEIQLENNWSKIAFCLYGKGLVDMEYVGVVAVSDEELQMFYPMLPVEMNAIRVKTRFPIDRNVMIAIGAYANLDRRDLHLLDGNMKVVDLSTEQKSKNRPTDVAEEWEPIAGDERTAHVAMSNPTPKDTVVNFEEVAPATMEWNLHFLAPAPNILGDIPELSGIVSGDYMVMESDSGVFRICGPVKGDLLVESVGYGKLPRHARDMKAVKVHVGKPKTDIYLAEASYDVAVFAKDGDPIASIEVMANTEDDARTTARRLVAAHLGLEMDKLKAEVRND